MICNEYTCLKETIYYEKMNNGLDVYLIPKGKRKVCGLISVDFGAVDTSFTVSGERFTESHGVAHFLEHKMFEKNGNDIEEKFNELGASVNAFTSDTRTVYYFNTYQEIEKCVDYLFDLVGTLDITDERVEREKDIIIQELESYEDDWHWQSYMGVLKNLYYDHPVREDVVGTKESIRLIDRSMLERAYDAFYTPDHMTLVIVGDIEPETLMESIRDLNNISVTKKVVVKNGVVEPIDIRKQYECIYRDICMPEVNIGIKMHIENREPKELLRKQLSMNILIGILFSTGSDFFYKLQEKGLINDRFNAEFTLAKDYAYFIIGGETVDPDGFSHEIYETISKMLDIFINRDDFIRIKRRMMGDMIRNYERVDTMAEVFSEYIVKGINAFEIIDEFNGITVEDVEECLQLFDERKVVEYRILSSVNTENGN